MRTTYHIRGERLRSLREDLGLSQTEVARAASRLHPGVNQGHISKVELNQKAFSVEALGAIASVLQTSADYLLGLTDDPTRREDMDQQVILTERDPVRRERLQYLFGLIEKLPADKRDAYWAMIETLHAGLVADKQKADWDKVRRTPMR